MTGAGRAMQRRTDPPLALVVHFRYATHDVAAPMRGCCDLPRWLGDALGQWVVERVATFKHVEIGVHQTALRGIDDALANRRGDPGVEYYTLRMLNSGGNIVWRAFREPNYTSLCLPCGRDAIAAFYAFSARARRRAYDYRFGDVYLWPRSYDRRGSYCTALVCEALQAAGFLAGVNPTEASADFIYEALLELGATPAMTEAAVRELSCAPDEGVSIRIT